MNVARVMLIILLDETARHKVLMLTLLLFMGFSAPGSGAVWAADHPASNSEATVVTSKFGSLEDGTPVDLYTLKNTRGASAKITTFGATLTELWMPDRSGKLGDVVLGFDNLQGYLGKEPFFGATVGRVTNRIAKGKFTLDGKEYSLEINDPPNTLHSGTHDLSRKVWKAEPVHERNGAAVRFSIDSPDGDEGFPGNLHVTVLYRLTNYNELQLEYTAKTDKATPVNLTNHSYFNLGGGKDVLGHVLHINADKYTPTDAALIPTGEIRPVKGTPLDFTKHIAEIPGTPGGYDHNFVVNGELGKFRLAARVYDPSTGRQMEVLTTEPAVQFYTGNFLDGTNIGKGGVAYEKHAGFCLETQHFPDSVNHPAFPSTILRPASVLSTQTTYKFSTR